MDRCWPMETVVDQSLNYCQHEMDLDRQTLIVPVIVRSSRHLLRVRSPMVMSSLLAAAVVVVVGFQMVEQLSLVLCRAMVCVTTDNCKKKIIGGSVFWFNRTHQTTYHEKRTMKIAMLDAHVG